MPRRVRLVLVGLALLLGACGTADPARLDPAQAGTAERPRDVNVILRDYVFVPTPLRLVPGEMVRFNIINGGLTPHEFVLGERAVQAAWAAAEAAATPPAMGATVPPASVPPALAGMRVLLGSGASGTVVYRVPDAAAASRLELACQIPGHVAKGMVGRLEFVAPEGGPTLP